MALATKIRILTIPPGQAPLSVRMAWSGSTCPSIPGASAASSGWPPARSPRLAGGGSASLKAGYAVNALEAVNLLQAKDPVAAAWWREHCAHLLDGKRSFLFPSAGCEERP